MNREIKRALKEGTKGKFRLLKLWWNIRQRLIYEADPKERARLQRQADRLKELITRAIRD